jgi:hypothetical protein
MLTFSFSEREKDSVLVSPIASNRYMLESSSNRHEFRPVTNEWLAVKDVCSMILAYTSSLSYVQMALLEVGIGDGVITRDSIILWPSLISAHDDGL